MRRQRQCRQAHFHKFSCWSKLSLVVLSLLFSPNENGFAYAFTSTTASSNSKLASSSSSFCLQMSQQQSQQPTELPDSLEDASERAAEATASFLSVAGAPARCRVDFDTSVGDETYTMLSSSTEFMQFFVAKCSYAMIPGLMEERQVQMMAMAQASAELSALEAEANDGAENEEGQPPPPTTEEEQSDNIIISSSSSSSSSRMEELRDIVSSSGRGSDYQWKGGTVRIYFPDEGSAALARRDWPASLAFSQAGLPPGCWEFTSSTGFQGHDISKDVLVFFFCPQASESEQVEDVLQRHELESTNLQLSCFVNPKLVNMGVTGYGMAGRMLRERLIDPLEYTYYLRTLPWGALTRRWPGLYSVWQEDDNVDSGYRIIKTMDRLPSNPEVEDIYDIANGDKQERQSGGLLDQFGDFVNGMMRL